MTADLLARLDAVDARAVAVVSRPSIYNGTAAMALAQTDVPRMSAALRAIAALCEEADREAEAWYERTVHVDRLRAVLAEKLHD